jgi:succinate dehydrogenase/fumarate reductase cytochrome b subunit (b558 family)
VVGSEDEQAAGTELALRALHSVTGVFPVGVFMLLELWLHAKAVQGPDAHRAAMELTARAGLWQWGVIAPLLFHVAFGLWLIARARYTASRYSTSRNWMFTLQRASGVVALAFIGYHAATLWLPVELGRLGSGDVYEQLTARLSGTEMGVAWAALGYIVGIAACCFHFANGLWAFSIRWGMIGSRVARARAALALSLFGVASFAYGANTVLFLATGWHLGGDPAATGGVVCAEAPASTGAPSSDASAPASAAASPGALAPTPEGAP